MCSLRQYHAPGTSRQEEYGYHSGYSPTPGTEIIALKMPRGFPGACLWNTVVMWTNRAKDEAGDTKQVPTQSLALTHTTSSSLKRMQHLSPLPLCSWTWRTPGSMWRTTSAVTTLSNCSRYHRPCSIITALHYSKAHHHHHYQAETMHKMVETFEYDGEHFALRVHACANTDVSTIVREE